MADWLPAIIPTALFGSVLWLGRNLILTRLTASVSHEFDARIEHIRSEVRQREEVLRANLHAQEVELAALREGALSAMASRQMAVNTRRIEAVDQLWSAVATLRSAKTAVMVLSVINFDVAAARAPKEPKLRQFFQEVGGQSEFTQIDLSAGTKARPFVSAPAWASYTALLSILGFAGLRLGILRSGLDPTIMADSANLHKVLTAVLPHQQSLIEKYGDKVHPLLVEEIENKLLTQLQDMLTGADVGKDTLANAAEILKRANELQRETSAKRVDLSQSQVAP